MRWEEYWENPPMAKGKKKGPKTLTKDEMDKLMNAVVNITPVSTPLVTHPGVAKGNPFITWSTDGYGSYKYELQALMENAQFKELLEKNPALRELWEQFLVMYKMVEGE